MSDDSAMPVRRCRIDKAEVIWGEAIPGRKHEGRQRQFNCSYLLMAVEGKRSIRITSWSVSTAAAAAVTQSKQIGVGAIEPGLRIGPIERC